MNPLYRSSGSTGSSATLICKATLQEANQSLGQCVDGLIDEVDRIQAVNEEILRTAEAMAEIGKSLG